VISGAISRTESERLSEAAALERRVKTLESHSGWWPLFFAVFALFAMTIGNAHLLPRHVVESNRICVRYDAAWPWENQSEDLWACAANIQIVGHSLLKTP
jgi:hypothetical protein